MQTPRIWTWTKQHRHRNDTNDRRRRLSYVFYLLLYIGYTLVYKDFTATSASRLPHPPNRSCSISVRPCPVILRVWSTGHGQRRSPTYPELPRTRYQPTLDPDVRRTARHEGVFARVNGRMCRGHGPFGAVGLPARASTPYRRR